MQRHARKNNRTSFVGEPVRVFSEKKRGTNLEGERTIGERINHLRRQGGGPCGPLGKKGKGSPSKGTFSGPRRKKKIAARYFLGNEDRFSTGKGSLPCTHHKES